MKKNAKKLMAAAMAALMAASMTACGGSKTETTSAADTTAAESAADAAETTAAGAAEAAKDGEKKVLKVAMECAYAPYNWTQPDDSNGAVPIADSNEYAYGYDVMMAKKICEELGYDLQIVRLDWDSLIPALQSGQADCVIAGQSITQERLQAVDFSEPYYYASIVTLVKKRQQLCRCNQRRRSGRCNLYLPAEHYLVSELPAADPGCKHSGCNRKRTGYAHVLKRRQM